MCLLNYLAGELQKVTHHNEIGGIGGGTVAELALRPRHDMEQGKTLSGRYTSDCPDLL